MNDLQIAVEKYKFLIEYWIEKDHSKIAKPLKELSLILSEFLIDKGILNPAYKRIAAPITTQEPIKIAPIPVFIKEDVIEIKKSKSRTRSRGEDIPNWPKIRKQILKRDEEKCRICTREYYLHVHHIDWDRTNNLESNLVTLCEPCHRTVHREGYKPWNDDYPAPWNKREIDEYNQAHY